jgi:HNH endonuclease
MADRWRDKVEFAAGDECWNWVAGVAASGYGRISRGAEGPGVEYAHRVAWTVHNGPIPAGMTIDHICLNRRCQNPAHLQLLTRSENGARAWVTSNPADRPYSRADDALPCSKGHLDWYRNPRGDRMCRVCSRERHRATYKHKKPHPQEEPSLP